MNNCDVGVLSSERNTADELRRKIRECAVLEQPLLAFGSPAKVKAVGSVGFDAPPSIHAALCLVFTLNGRSLNLEPADQTQQADQQRPTGAPVKNGVT